MASVEALYVIRFRRAGDKTPGEYKTGQGVIVLETERVLGGDSTYVYVGTYVIGATAISGRIEAHRHGSDEDVHPVFDATKQFVFEFVGEDDSEHVDGERGDYRAIRLFARREDSGAPFEATLYRMKELP